MKKDLVCPSCGCVPFDEDKRRQKLMLFCSECGDKFINRKDLPHDIWKDPAVREALKDRPPYDICLLRCPKCDELGYYNQGSSFTCRFCDKSYYVLSEGERLEEGVATMDASDMITLDDSFTETTDGYHNHTG